MTPAQFQQRQQQAYVPPKLPSTVACGQKDDTAGVRIPSPEELGIAAARNVVTGDESIDWKMVERRMSAAGVKNFQIDKAGDKFSCVCQLATRDVIGQGATRAEAVRNAASQLPH